VDGQQLKYAFPYVCFAQIKENFSYFYTRQRSNPLALPATNASRDGRAVDTTCA
jgi:hypothetical protein